MTSRTHNWIRHKFFLLLCAFLPALSFADALTDVAGIIAAASPIAFAAAEASSAQASARSAAQFGVFQAQTAADVSRYQTDSVERIENLKLKTGYEVAHDNNVFASNIQGMQLNEIHHSFDQAISLAKDSFNTVMNYKYQKLALDESLAEKEIKLQAEKNRAERVAQGIDPGVNNVGSTANPGGAGARAMKGPTLRLLDSSKDNKVAASYRNGFFARGVASGSSRSKRNVSSDLSAFQRTLGARSFVNDSTLVSHARRDSASSGVLAPFRAQRGETH